MEEDQYVDEIEVPPVVWPFQVFDLLANLLKLFAGLPFKQDFFFCPVK